MATVLESCIAIRQKTRWLWSSEKSLEYTLNHCLNPCFVSGTRKEQGFTLLELLLALSLMAVLITLVFSAFHLGSRAWEKGEKLNHNQQVLRVVPDLVRRQLVSLALPEVVGQDGKTVFFRSEEKSLDFFSNISLFPENKAGIVYVRYRIIKLDTMREKLSFYERNINLLDGSNFPEIEETSYLDLLSGYTSIVIDFMPAVSEENESAEWQPNWDTEVMGGLPKAIRLSFVKDKSDVPIIVIVPVLMKPSGTTE